MDHLIFQLRKAGLIKNGRALATGVNYVKSLGPFVREYTKTSLPRLGEAVKQAPVVGKYAQKVLGAPKPKFIGHPEAGVFQTTPYGQAIGKLDAARAAKDLAYKNMSPWVKYPAVGLGMYAGYEGVPLSPSGMVPFWFHGYGKNLEQARREGANEAATEIGKRIEKAYGSPQVSSQADNEDSPYNPFLQPNSNAPQDSVMYKRPNLNSSLY